MLKDVLEGIEQHAWQPQSWDSWFFFPQTVRSLSRLSGDFVVNAAMLHQDTASRLLQLIKNEEFYRYNASKICRGGALRPRKMWGMRRIFVYCGDRSDYILLESLPSWLDTSDESVFSG